MQLENNSFVNTSLATLIFIFHTITRICHGLYSILGIFTVCFVFSFPLIPPAFLKFSTYFFYYYFRFFSGGTIL